jgi:ssDNA-binding Zn-finger/Zn-ribbon topoisomerase 1
MDEAMQAYSLAQLQTFRNMLITLDRNELTIDQFLRYIWFRSMVQETRVVKPCPECQEDMVLFPINQSPCTQIGGKWQSQWYCETCGHDELQKATVFKVAHDLRKKTYPFVEHEKKYKKEMLEWEIAQYMKRPLEGVCPDCGKRMLLYSITTPLGRANLKGYKSVWFCDLCGYEKYLNRTVTEEATRLRRT